MPSLPRAPILWPSATNYCRRHADRASVEEPRMISHVRRAISESRLRWRISLTYYHKHRRRLDGGFKGRRGKR